MPFHFLSPKARIHFAATFLIATLLIISGCSSAASETPRQVTISNVQVQISTPTQPYAFKTSDPGTITIHGTLVVLDPTSMMPSPDNGIYLVPMPTDQANTSIPQFEVGTVPQAEVDEISGEFSFTNIQPGQYAVVVMTPSGSQIPVRYQENQSYAIINLDASQKDTTVDLGHLTLP